MSDEDTIKDLIAQRREDLQHAMRVLEATPRPPNVCGSHDALFALQKAEAGAMDTLLAVFAGRMGAAVETAEKVTWAFIVRAYGRTLIWACAAIIIVALVFGRLGALADIAERLAKHDQVTQYQPQG